jgi:hypothetical protein
VRGAREGRSGEVTDVVRSVKLDDQRIAKRMQPIPVATNPMMMRESSTIELRRIRSDGYREKRLTLRAYSETSVSLQLCRVGFE